MGTARLTSPTVDFPTRDECVVGPLLDRWAREQPRRNFLEFSDGCAWTFAEMRTRAQRAAAALRGLGVARGSHVLSWMPNEREAILGWFGANLLGAHHRRVTIHLGQDEREFLAAVATGNVLAT